MFFQNCVYFGDDRRVLLLKDLVGDGTGKHMAANVPDQSGERQYSKREKDKKRD